MGQVPKNGRRKTGRTNLGYVVHSTKGGSVVGIWSDNYKDTVTVGPSYGDIILDQLPFVRVL